MCKKLLVFLIFVGYCQISICQEENNNLFEIAGISTTGINYNDEHTIIARSGLKVGNAIQIPGNEISRAIKILWELKLFKSIKILKEEKPGQLVYLEIVVVEKPQFAEHKIIGVKKRYQEDLTKIINEKLGRGSIISQSTKSILENEIQDFFYQEGYPDAICLITEVSHPDDKSRVNLIFDVDIQNKVKIDDINFIGAKKIKPKKLRSILAHTKRKRELFSTSKFIEDRYDEDKTSLIAYYNMLGYKDAKITSDIILQNENGDVNIDIHLEEGEKYYFRNISFKGNTVYTAEELQFLLGIKKSDVYNTELLDTRVHYSPDGRDISSQYMDNGYLFFKVEPIEVALVNDSIDIEMRIFEGAQATINKVTISGNDKTEEEVIRRELRTQPGDKFSRTDLILSQRKIINLGYFNAEKLEIKTPIDVGNGTVDIEYKVEEKSSDRFELSGGWAGKGTGLVGSAGVTLNNFSAKKIFKLKSWDPTPRGSGQSLSLRAQTNGRSFQAYNISFTEPWLGKKKPNALSGGLFYSQYVDTDSEERIDSRINILGGSVGLGTRLKFMNSYIASQTTLTYKQIRLHNWQGNLFGANGGLELTHGTYNNININQTFVRSTLNDPFFPTRGSRFLLSAEFTPPYSLLNRSRDIEGETDQEKYRFAEYLKARFDGAWYKKINNKLVFKASAKIGALGSYNNKLGTSPFEKFVLGGDGLGNQTSGALGYDLISLRGYDIEDIDASENGGAGMFTKFTAELRYSVLNMPSARAYVLGFVEAGNAWGSVSDYNPFDLRRSAGVGLRIQVPMFGTLGFDYGIGIDKDVLNTGNGFLNNYGKFSVILGIEPE